MGLLDRIAAASRGEQRFGIDEWITDYLMPNQFSFNGHSYPFGVNQTYAGQRAREMSATLPAYANALRSCPPAFAAQLVRALVLSQARFVFRNRASSSTPRRTFGTTALGLLERPWTNATTGELLARMEWHAGLAGNAYVVRRPDRLRVLRPDWCAVLYGSEMEPDDPAHALDGEVIGYVYQNGGFTDDRHKPQTLLPSEVAHWSPIPDPEAAGVGMSWITPAVRDIQADQSATEHKLMYFTNGATPNMVVKGIPAVTKGQFDEIVDAMEARHTGVRNAYRTLYLTAGADATVVGSNMHEIDFKSTLATGETRISVLSRVPAALLGISEGLSGSSLNAGNFGMARRIFSDSWLHPTLQDVCAALATLIKVPNDAELWFDTGDIPLLREDAKDAAEIESVKAQSIVKLATGGFTRQSAIAAVQGQDMSLLQEDPDWVSVQVQPGQSTQLPLQQKPVPLQQQGQQQKGQP